MHIHIANAYDPNSSFNLLQYICKMIPMSWAQKMLSGTKADKRSSVESSDTSHTFFSFYVFNL